MKDHVALIDQLSGDRPVANAVDLVVKAWVIFQMLNVAKSASGKIVNDENFVAALKIRVGKMRADEPRSPCDQNSQTSDPLQTIASNARRQSSTVIAGSRFRAGACAFAGSRVDSNELAIQLSHVRQQTLLCIILQDKVSTPRAQISSQRFVFN